jgi:hypothetical protein
MISKLRVISCALIGYQVTCDLQVIGKSEVRILIVGFRMRDPYERV